MILSRADRLRTALLQVADLIAVDDGYARIFDRLDREVAAIEANDPIARARIIAATRQRAME